MKRWCYTLYQQTHRWLKWGVWVLSVLLFLNVSSSSMAQSKKVWYPLEVDVWNPPFNDQLQRNQQQYIPQHFRRRQPASRHPAVTAPARESETNHETA